MILVQSLVGENGFTLSYLTAAINEGKIFERLANSVIISLISAVITTILSFIVAFTINYTNLPRWFKQLIAFITMLPMFLPTITYGFAIIYSFGPQGLWNRLLNLPEFNIYGFNGLVMGFVIYTLPIAFLLINNSMRYTDKRQILVARLLGDSKLRMFHNTILKPVLPAFVTAIIQTFFLSFTDFGIPTSLGGKVSLVSDFLYQQMMGAIPDFNKGAAVALFMLLPAVLSVILLNHVSKKQIQASSGVTVFGIEKNWTRDMIACVISLPIVAFVLSIFTVILILPVVQSWPYNTSFTWEHVQNIFSDRQLIGTYQNSLTVAVITALLGTVIAYASALFTARSANISKISMVVTGLSAIVNTIPGMVLGIAYLLTFSGSSLQGTFVIIIVANVVHYFATPYLTFKDSLSKLSQNWEVTANLLGDGWFKVIFKILIPNTKGTIVEILAYYFINAMVTVSAVIFLINPSTMLITTKIKELQYFNSYNEIFVLSLLILFTNLLVYGLSQFYIKKES